MCRSLNHSNAYEVDDDQDLKIDIDGVGAITNVDRIKSSHWFVEVTINGKPLKCKIDTGADVNILSLQMFNSLDLPADYKLLPSNTQLEAFGGFKLYPVGQVILPVKLGSKISHECFVVIDNDKCTSILGLSSSVSMGLVSRSPVDAVTGFNKCDMNTFIQQNKDVFYNQGCFPDVLRLKLKEGAIPKSQPARRVPFKIMGRLKEKLDSLEQRGIIVKSEAGEWVHNLVVVEKHKTGDLRICIDPKELNKYLIRDYCLIPTLDEVTSKLKNKNFFCSFDLRDGFHQIRLDDYSSKLCTFSTPFGIYRYIRAPFGLSVLPEYFQKMTQKHFGHIDGAVVYFDDILCAGETEEELGEVVKKVVNAARENHIQLNPNKTQYFVEEVKFCGHIFGKFGVKPDEDRIKAIKELKTPACRKELQRILGTVNYLRPFIPNLAGFCIPFQDLMKKNVHWQWTENHDVSFQKLKEAIEKSALLVAFQVDKPLVIQADASQNALGCALFQDGKPILYGSRTLTDTEADYAQVEKELLAISFAFKKFHNFAYGNKNITVETDHAPLTAVMNKNMNQIANNRLRRLRLKLLPYSFQIKYVPGKNLHVADLLSRQCEPTHSVEDESMLDTIHVLNADVKINPKTINEYIKATREDEALNTVMKYFQDGWPKSLKSMNQDLNHYFSVRNDLTVHNNLVYYDCRLVVPRVMRRYTLQTLHETHLGLKKLKAKAQELVYWPGLSSDLTNLVSSCYTCAKFQRANKKEPLLPHEIIDVPFFKVAADIAEYQGVSYLVLVDYFSRWIEIEKLKDKSAKSVIGVLKSIFSRFGIPHIFVSDNVPFNSSEFMDFANLWNFQLVTSSPHYPRSNGLVEKAVGIAKSMLQKSQYEKSDLHLYLMNYRSSPVASLKYSPAQLLQSRVLNTKIPALPQVLKPKLVNDSKVIDKSSQRYNYNRTALKKERQFVVGQSVIVRNIRTKQWEKGTIVKALGFRSYLVKINNGTYRRNSWFLKPFTNGRRDASLDVYLAEGENTADTRGQNAGDVRREDRIVQNTGVRHSSRPVRAPERLDL